MLAEQHDDWIEGRRYLGLEVLARSRVALITTDETTTDKEDLTPTALWFLNSGSDVAHGHLIRTQPIICSGPIDALAPRGSLRAVAAGDRPSGAHDRSFEEL